MSILNYLEFWRERNESQKKKRNFIFICKANCLAVSSKQNWINDKLRSSIIDFNVYHSFHIELMIPAFEYTFLYYINIYLYTANAHRTRDWNISHLTIANNKQAQIFAIIRTKYKKKTTLVSTVQYAGERIYRHFVFFHSCYFVAKQRKWLYFTMNYFDYYCLFISLSLSNSYSISNIFDK